MARLFIYDSSATVDAAGSAVAMSLQNDIYRASKPVRLYGCVDAPINDIGYEFLFDGNQSVASAVDLYWYQEFFNDTPGRTEPSARSAPGVVTTYGWSREQLQYSTGALISGSQVAAQVEHYDIRRHAVIADGTTYFAAGGTPPFSRSLYFPCRVHALFVRLQVAIHSMPSGTFRLRIWAIVGGQDQQVAQENLLVPYAPEL